MALSLFANKEAPRINQAEPFNLLARDHPICLTPTKLLTSQQAAGLPYEFLDNLLESTMLPHGRIGLPRFHTVDGASCSLI